MRTTIVLGLAAVTTRAIAAPDMELGRYLAQECVTCHRAANPASTIPNIYGMAETTFSQVIRAYRDKKLENVVMQNVAARLRDEEIEALAAFFFKTRP